ncbi:MAG TPA: uroporphyrinogen decarboxylase family protein [bacterium]|nr:uroporphyrinogen decarboxylase family protein [bacterium]HQO34376.1 uroporphyrinogen decarboxylase family protein [bacterium]HQQ00012.1 uroporphyrinogen decarboxylase family protein [bacterium]
MDGIPKNMNARERFAAYLEGRPVDRLPRIESKFADDTVELWRAQGHLDNRPPEEFFNLDRHESVPILPRKFDPPDDPRTIWPSPETWYDAADPRRFPENWSTWCDEAASRDYLVSFEPWHEGMFQVLGIRSYRSFVPVIFFLMDEPQRVRYILDFYTEYLEELIERVCADVKPDYAICYEPIASNAGLVISPEMARRFLEPCYRRICARLEKHGIRHRFAWSSGHILPMIPLWMDCGINGLFVDQACAAGVDYLEVRRQYGTALALMGGINNHTLRQGERAMIEELQRKVPPLLESGRYIPGLDDAVRADIPFERFVKYREWLLGMVEGG